MIPDPFGGAHYIDEHPENPMARKPFDAPVNWRRILPLALLVAVLIAGCVWVILSPSRTDGGRMLSGASVEAGE
jgi:hypothetical protein